MICAAIADDRGPDGPMAAAVRLARTAGDAELDTLAAFGRCLAAAVQAERGQRAATAPPRPRNTIQHTQQNHAA